MAQFELKERGQFAKFATFTSQWPVANQSNAQRLMEEMERLTTTEGKYDLALRDMTTEQQWRVCLRDGYDLLFKVAAVPAGPDADVVPTPILGHFGIRQLLLDGKLMDMPRHEFLEELHQLDHRSMGVITFEELFHWFCRIAYSYEAKAGEYYHEEEDFNRDVEGGLAASFKGLFSGTGGSTASAAAATPSGMSSSASTRAISLRPASQQEKDRRAKAARKIKPFTLSTLVSVRIQALIQLYKRFGSDSAAEEEFDMAAFKNAYQKMKKKKAQESDVDIDLTTISRYRHGHGRTVQSMCVVQLCLQICLCHCRYRWMSVDMSLFMVFCCVVHTSAQDWGSECAADHYAVHIVNSN